MTPRRTPRPQRLLVVALALLVAGCLDDTPPPADVTEDDAPVGSTAAMGYRVKDGGLDGGAANATLFLVRTDGAAERFTFLPDETGVARLAPDLVYPQAELDRVFEMVGGAFVHRVESGRIEDAAAVDELRDALEQAAPTAYTRWSGTGAAYARAADENGGAWTLVAAGADQNATDGRVADAFAAAEAAFTIERDQQAEGPDPGSIPPCVRTRLDARPQAFHLNESVTVQVDVENCGDSVITLHEMGCGEQPFLNIGVRQMHGPQHGTLATNATPGSAYATDLRCRSPDAEPLVVAPGATVRTTRAWNGTFAACRALDDCAYETAAPGTYRFDAYAGHGESRGAEVVVLPDEGDKVPLLVVREVDQVETESHESAVGDFGPHCAPVKYTLDPSTVTLRHYDETPALRPHAVVVRDWRDGPRPNHTMTFSADRLDVLTLEENESSGLASPFDPTHNLTVVELVNGTFVVDGMPLEPGARLTREYEHVVETEDGVYRTTSTLRFLHAGPAYLFHEQSYGCM